MSRYIFFILFFSLFSSCTPTRFVKTSDRLKDSAGHPTVTLFREYNQYLASKDLISMSSGVTETSKTDKVESFFIMAVTNQPMRWGEARTTVVDAVESLVERVNQHKELRKYLLAHPISPSRIHFSLIVSNPKGDYYKEERVVSKCTLRDGLLRFYTFKESEESEDPTAGEMVLLDQELYQEVRDSVRFR